MPFSCIFPAGAVGAFALFVFISLSAQSIGLSASTGPAMVADIISVRLLQELVQVFRATGSSLQTCFFKIRS